MFVKFLCVHALISVSSNIFQNFPPQPPPPLKKFLIRAWNIWCLFLKSWLDFYYIASYLIFYTQCLLTGWYSSMTGLSNEDLSLYRLYKSDMWGRKEERINRTTKTLRQGGVNWTSPLPRTAGHNFIAINEISKNYYYGYTAPSLAYKKNTILTKITI